MVEAPMSKIRTHGILSRLVIFPIERIEVVPPTRNELWRVRIQRYESTKLELRHKLVTKHTVAVASDDTLGREECRVIHASVVVFLLHVERGKAMCGALDFVEVEISGMTVIDIVIVLRKRKVDTS
jgi:hypothetical protein